MSTTNTVTGLHAGKARRIGQLLERRATVGTAWAERISHALDGFEDLTAELLLVEMAIADQWPQDVDGWMRQWIVADATKLHDPAERRDDCSICTSVGEQSAAA